MTLLAIYHLIIFSFTLCVCKDAEDDFRAVEGDAVRLPCHLPPKDSKQVTVEWRKHSNHSIRTTICKWNIHINNITGSNRGECIPRFKFNINSFTLSIENVQLSDSGDYSGKITRIIPPPTLDYISTVTLQVAVRLRLSLQILNSSNETCIHLLCLMESLTPERVNFTWAREGHESLHPFTTYAMKSELRLCKPDRHTINSDRHTITCYANSTDTQTLHIRNITLDFSLEGQTEIHLPVCVVLFGIFIISISFIWMLFFILQYKDRQRRSSKRP